MSKPIGRPITAECGTEPAYKRAQRYKAQGKPHCGPCQPCKDAWAAASRKYYAKRMQVDRLGR